MSTQNVFIPGDIAYVTGTINGVTSVWTLTADHIWSAQADTAADGIYVIVLIAIDTAGNELNVTTTAYEGLHLKTDWTAADYYNAEDLNRVGAAVVYIAAQLNKAGYPCTVSPVMSWTSECWPTPEAMAHYIAQVQAIKDTFYGTGELPESMANLTPEKANQIEQLLKEVENYYTIMLAGMVARCGVTKTGGYI